MKILNLLTLRLVNIMYWVFVTRHFVSAFGISARNHGRGNPYLCDSSVHSTTLFSFLFKGAHHRKKFILFYEGILFFAKKSIVLILYFFYLEHLIEGSRNCLKVRYLPPLIYLIIIFYTLSENSGKYEGLNTLILRVF